MAYIDESARKTPVLAEADVLVVGGGSAGMAAAIAAARAGAHTILLEQDGFLGGTLTATGLGSLCGYYTVCGSENRPVVGGIPMEVLERLRRAGAATWAVRWREQTAVVPYNIFGLKVLADQMITEAGVQLMLHVHAVGVVCEAGAVRGVLIESKAGRHAVLGKVVIDCTGDGDIAWMAGAPYELDLHNLQFPTAMFRLAGMDQESLKRLNRLELQSHMERAIADGMVLPRRSGGMNSANPAEVNVNITRVSLEGRPPNPLDIAELTRAELIGRAQVGQYEHAFRRFVPGFERAVVTDCGARLGIRESRRITGEYSLEVKDVLESGRFPDAVACGAWPVEEHRSGQGQDTRWVFLDPGAYYQIPFRCLVPRGVARLLMAGRCVCATHEAHASLRVAATCMAMGQAVGVAAAMCADRGIDTRQLPTADLQSELLAQGVMLQ